MRWAEWIMDAMPPASIIAGHRVRAQRDPMTGAAKQSRGHKKAWIASSLRSSQ
jgi:hypothetical protein